ncbi:MAG: HAMP domain-containing protein [Candidatus Magnetoovum sp. WYHC-5]|nr:HAMP domain-containing protein [Candidatus Magnetoovum sp. WYHC-5]
MDKAAVFNERLRNKMLMRILISTAVLLIVIGIVILIFTRKLFIIELEKQAQYKVAQASSQINGWLMEKSSYLDMVARLITKAAEAGEVLDKEKFKAIFNESYGLSYVYMGFVDGSFITGSDWIPDANYDPRQRTWYLQALMAEKNTFTVPYKDAKTGKMIVTIAQPVIVNKRLIGVVATNLYINEIVSIIDTLKIGQGSYSHLVDDSGIYITHEDNELALKKDIRATEDGCRFSTFQANGGNTMGFEVDGYYKVFNRIPVSGWHIVFNLPLSEVNKPLNKLYTVFVGGFVIAVIALTITTNRTSKLITHPILTLVDGAKHITAGQYGFTINIPSKDEIGYLTASFNDMSKGLKDREFIKSTFGRFISDEIVKTLIETPEGLKLGGVKQRVTILMADIRGSTSLAERLPAELYVSIVNNFLGTMTDIIIKYGGTIDEFIGDAILAIFGAPVLKEDDATRAVACAIEMQNAMAAVNLWNRGQEYPEIEMGIGMNTGMVVVGNIGSSKRSKYGVVGKHVSLASRIESYTTGGEIIISEATKEGIGEILKVKKSLKVQPKGLVEPVILYYVTGLGGEYNLELKEEIETLVKLQKVVNIKFALLEGKHIDGAFYEGYIEEFSKKEAIVCVAIDDVNVLDNMKISVSDTNGTEIPGDVYAKVVEVDNIPKIKIRFTLIAPQVMSYFKEKEKKA